MAQGKGGDKVRLELEASLKGRSSVEQLETRLKKLGSLLDDLTAKSQKLSKTNLVPEDLKTLGKLTQSAGMGPAGNRKAEIAYQNALMKGVAAEFKASFKIMLRDLGKMQAEMLNASKQILRQQQLTEGSQGLTRRAIGSEANIDKLRNWRRGVESQLASNQLTASGTFGSTTPKVQQQAERNVERLSRVLNSLDNRLKEVSQAPARAARQARSRVSADQLFADLQSTSKASGLRNISRQAETARRKLGKDYAASVARGESDPAIKTAFDNMGRLAREAARKFGEAFDAEAKAKASKAAASRQGLQDLQTGRSTKDLKSAEVALTKQKAHLESLKKARAQEVTDKQKISQLNKHISETESAIVKTSKRIVELKDKEAAATLRSMKPRGKATEELKEQLRLVKKITKELEGRGSTKLADDYKRRAGFLKDEIARLDEIAQRQDRLKGLKQRRNVNEALFGQDAVSRTLNTPAHDRLQQNQQLLSALKSEQRALTKIRAEREAIGKLTTKERREIEKMEDSLRNQRSRLESRVQQIKGEGSKYQAEDLRRKNYERLTGDGGAALLGIQARLGLNYMVLGSITGGIQEGLRFTVELEKEFKQLQAITNTTDTEMGELERTLVAVSQQTKFTAVEVAQAAVTLGQAGFSTNQIAKSMEAITLFATATGTDLAKSVDIATSVLGVFKKSAEETEQVMNQLTTAINNSKLTTDKMTLGIQYAGNIAAQSGVEFTELVSALGAMANSGIRAGSTLGTGMRQILIALNKPSEEFKATLVRLGLSMADIDVRSKGLYGVLKTLKDGGFSAGDAIKSFEVRAAAAFNAIQNNLYVMEDLEESQLDTVAAFKANETQMEALANQWDRFASILKTTVATALAPALESVNGLIHSLANMLEEFNQLEGAAETLQFFGNVIATVTGGMVIMLGAKMLKGFASLFLVTDKLKGTGAALAKTFGGELATGATRMSTILQGLKMAGLALTRAFLPLSLAMGAVYVAMQVFKRENDTIEDSLDATRAAVDKAQGSVEGFGDTLTVVAREMDRLKDRRLQLLGDEDQAAQELAKTESALRSVGLAFGESIGTSVDLAIDRLKELRGQVREMELQALQGAKQAAEIHRSNLQESQGLIKERLKSSLTEVIGQKQTRAEFQRQRQQQSARGEFPTPFRAKRTLNDRILQSELGAVTGGNQAIIDVVKTLVAGGTPTNTNLKIATDNARALQSQGFGGDNAKRDQYIIKTLIDEFQLLQQVISGINNQDRKLRRTESEIRVNQLADDPQIVALQGRMEAFDNLVDNNRRAISAQTTDKSVDALTLFKRVKQGGGGIEGIGSIESQMDTLEADIQEFINQRVRYAQEALVALNDTSTTSEDVRKLGEQVRSDLTEALSESTRKMAESMGDAIKISDQTKEDAKPLFNYDTEKSRSALKGELSAIAKSMRSAQTVERLNDLTDSYYSKLVELKAVEDRIAAFKFKDADLEVALRGNADNLAAGRKQGAELRHAGQLSLDRKSDQAAFTRFRNDNKRRLDDDGFKRRKISADQRVKQLENAKAFIDSPENSAHYSSAQREQLAEQIRQAKVDRTKLLSDLAQQETNAIGRTLTEIDRRLAQTAAAIEANNKELDTEISGHRRNELDSQNQELTRQQSKLLVDQADLRKKNSDEVERMLELLEQIKQLETEVAQQDLFEGMLTTLEQYNKGLDWTVTGVEGFRNVLDASRSGLNQFYKDVVDGNMTIGDSFKNLAVGVIRAMQDMVTQMLAVQTMQVLIGKGGGAAGGVTGGLLGGAINGISSFFRGGSNPLNIGQGGGIGLAGGGSVVGGVPNRDSVAARLMPGEFVLKKSAADSVGQNFLNQLNNKGAQALSQGPQNLNIIGEGGGEKLVNVWVVSPDQVPPPSESDIVTVIGDNIARKGRINQLIKQVNMRKL